MPDGFEIAKGYVKIHAEYERDLKREADKAGQEVGESLTEGVKRRVRKKAPAVTAAVTDAVTPPDAGKTGEKIGESLGDGLVAGVGRRIRNSKGQFVKPLTDAVLPDSEKVGEESGRSFLSRFLGIFHSRKGDGTKAGSTIGGAITGGISDALTGGAKVVSNGLGGLMSSVGSSAGSNPYVAAGIAAIGASVAAVLLPAMGAAIAGVLIGGSGLAVIIGGALLAVSRDPELKSAAGDLMKTIMGVDTAPLQDAYTQAQAKYTEAVKSGSKERIAQARQEVAETKKALDEAREFNEGNASLPDMARGSLFQPLMDSIGLLKQGFKDLQPDIQKAFDAVAPAIKPLVEGFLGFSKEAMPGFLKMLEASGPFLTSLAEVMPILGKGVGKFFENISEGGPGAATFFKDLITIFADWLAGIGKVIGFLAKAYQKIHDFFAAIPGWIQAAKDWFAGLGKSISEWASGIWSSITGFFTKSGDRVSTWVTDVKTWIKNALDYIGSIPGKVGAFLMALPGVLKTAAENAFHAFFFAIGFAIGATVAYLLSVPERLGNALSTLGTWIVGAWNTAWAWIGSVISTSLQWVEDQWHALPGRASAALASLKESISNKFQEVKTAVVAKVTETINSVITWWNSLPSKAGEALSGMKASITGALSGAKDWLLQAGADIIAGLANGIKGAVGSAVKAAKDAVKDIVDGAKKGLGIGSPSKVFAAEVGEWIPPGISMGLDRAMPPLIRDMESMGPELANATGPVGRAPGGGTVYNFAPGSLVIDASKLTDIQSLLKMIDSLKSTSRQYSARGIPSGVTA